MDNFYYGLENVKYILNLKATKIILAFAKKIFQKVRFSV